ncbi:membrane alanyl aminopeptidase [Flavobacteriaceae bacterium UJ101]|nr:membrane alanyl aminopeptidase [Flavobacteriaceae bacterium UJ101]
MFERIKRIFIRMKHFFLVSWTLFYSSFAWSQIDAYWQQHIDYKMDIEVNTKDFTYDGNQVITYQNNSPNTLHKVYFHLYWNAFQPNSMMDQKLVTSGNDGDTKIMQNKGTKENPKWVSEISLLDPKDYGKQEIISLTQKGKPLQYQIEGTILEVELAQPILPNTSSQFEMKWKTFIPPVLRRGGKNNTEEVDFSMTQWYPKMAEYDYDGWHADEYIGKEFHGVFGNFDVKITIDPDYVVGAGGEIQNPNEVNGYGGKPKKKQTYHFITKNIHDFAWVADKDFVVEVQQPKIGPKTYYVYNKEKYGTYWKEVKPYVAKFWELMNRTFGEYQYPTYSILQGGDGGMEYGACTLIMGKHDSLEDLASLIFHEAGHSWFQHIIATDENTEAWLDEGLTTYAQDLCDDVLFNKRQNNPFGRAYGAYLNAHSRGKVEPMSTLADHFKTKLGYSIGAYFKAEVFFSQLGYIIGEENLQKTLKEYFNTWKLKHPTSRDLKHIAQEVSGMNLRWYFNQFVTTTDIIDYKIKEVKAIGDKTQVTLENLGGIAMPIDFYTIDQTGKPQIFYIPLKLLRGEKPNDYPNLDRKVLPDWGWTQKEYIFTIDQPLSNFKTFVIDASTRLADVNYDNNIYENK